MAHDANFVDDRLRLAAFLRLVENGMPQRPSRFTRHGQAVVGQLYNFNATPACLGEAKSSLLRMNQKLPWIRSTLSTSANPNHPDTNAHLSAAGNAESNQTKALFYQETDFDTTRTQTPERLRSDAIPNEGHGTHTSQHSAQPCSIVPPIKSLSEDPVPTHGPDISKSRLPVNELALLRSTTLDGLPEPAVRPAIRFKRYPCGY